jgi:Right handed beta helix region
MAAVFRLLTIVGLALAAATPAEGATFHVAKAGCLASGPGSQQQPWCSVAQAVNRLRPGDTLQVHGGSYPEQVVIKVSGASATKPIVIEAAPGEKAIIDGTKLTFDEQGLIYANKQRHLVVRGLEVRQSPFYCVLFSGSTNVTLEKLKVDGCKHGGIVFDEGSSQVKVLDNEVTNTDRCGQGCGTHEAITLSDTSDFEVSLNNVHHGIKEGIDVKDGSARGTVHHNIVANMGQVGIYLNHATAVKVHNNTVHDCGSSGIQLAVGDFATGTPETTNNDLFQNVVYNCKWNGIELWKTVPGDLGHNRIYNNVFYANGSAAVQLRDATNNVLVNNIIALNKGSITGTLVWNNFISNNLFFKTKNDTDLLETQGQEPVVGDPLLVDAASGDFALRAASPAIDRGYEMGLKALGRPDIGAHEYQPPQRAADDGGCALAADAPTSLLAIFVSLALLVALARRRRRRGGQES